MKSKTIHAIIGAIVFIVVVVVWKLNSYYKQEKSALIEGQIHQQSMTLKTSISSQIAQLKNIISSYQGQVDESKINWVQINPFFALAQLAIAENGTYTVKNLFVKSGTPADNWSKDYLQKAFTYSPFSNKEIHGQLFQNQTGEKFLSLIFSEQKIQNSRQAVALVGDATYFQKYFDTVRSAKSTNLLMTSDDVVVGHTQADYIATKSQESKINQSKYFLDKDEIRSSNLSVLSYAPKFSRNEFLSIPLFVLIFVFGFAFLVIGILLYVLKPIEDEQRKADIFRKVFDEIQQQKPVESSSLSLDSTEPVLSMQSLQSLKREDYLNVEKSSMSNSEQREKSFEAPAPVSFVPEPIGNKKMALGEIVDLTLNSISEQIVASGVQIHKSYETEKQYDCHVDRFRKAIENILLNSIEAQAKNITIRVYADHSESNHPVNLDIIDDGRGVEPGTIDKIWQPFYGTKDKLKHKGLGLAEALSVVRRYGADVRVLENPKKGVTVRIEMESELRRLHQGQRPSEDVSVLNENTSTVGAGIIIDESRADIDIDAILNLRDDDESIEVPMRSPPPPPSKLNIEQEYTTTQFKMDEKVNIVSHPEIKVDKSDKPIDHFSVKVRKPGRT